jgi:hypothetical protein
VDAARAHFLQHADAVFAGKAQIQNDKRKRSGAQCDQSGIAVLHPVDGIAFGFEPVDDTFADHLIVFNQKDSHRWLLSCQTPVRQRLFLDAKTPRTGGKNEVAQ